MKFIADKIRYAITEKSDGSNISISLNDAEQIWFEMKFTKIVLAVFSEKELLGIKEQLEEKDIPVVLIVDDGTTEFNGQPTATCLGVGPWFTDEIDPITKHLKLFK
ncbi:hypothetical protein FACS189427_12060 [Planctomycetales bacterium]|nr:hypothetical protein FACS189427_12060 [Planctomycetales bacterium]